MTIILDGTQGTTTPGLYSNSAFTGTYVDGIVSDYTTGLGRISVGSSDGLAFYRGGVANTESMRIDSSGNVGIGTTTAYARLNVVNGGGGALATQYTYNYGASNWNHRMLPSGGSGVSGYIGNLTGDLSSFSGAYYYGGGLYYSEGTAAYGIINSANNNAICFYTNSGLTAGGTFTPTERMRIDSSGNVGIGTASPTLNTNGTVLHINNSTANHAAAVHMTNAESGSGAGDGLMVGKWSDGTSYFWDYDSYPLVFGTNSTERMRIDSSGNVGIGTIPPANSWPVANGYKALQTGSYGAISDYASGGGVLVSANSYAYALDSYKYINSYYATMYQQNAGTHRWFTAPSGTAGNAISFSESMRIDANGRVTTPSQPFVTGCLGCTTASGIANIVSSLVSQGGMTFVTDRVTAPVTGVYMITWQTICNTDTGRHDSRLLLNGVALNTALNEDNGTGFHQRTHTIAYKLSAGDYIQFNNAYWYNVGTTGGEWSTFSMYLLG